MGGVISNETIIRGERIRNYLSTNKEDAVDFTDDENFFDTLNAKFNVARVGMSKCKHGGTSNSLSHK